MIVEYPDPRLQRKAEPRQVDDGLHAIGNRLLEARRAANAYGLAAVHIGAVAPVAVVSVAPDAASRDYRVLYNPEIVELSGNSIPGPEGSVSMPGLEVDVIRPEWADIAFDDERGKRQQVRLEGWPARIAQHEIDQVNGIFFLDRLSRLKREMALKKWSKRVRP